LEVYLTLVGFPPNYHRWELENPHYHVPNDYLENDFE
jgi:hypothetical protein